MVTVGSFPRNKNASETLWFKPGNQASKPHFLNTSETHLKDIITRAKEGSQIAFSQLLDRFWGDVYGFQLSRTKNENDAEDITIQTFAKAFDKIDTYDPTYNFGTWLLTISKNLHVDLIRKRRKNVLDESETGKADEVNKVLDDSPTGEDALITEQNLASLLSDIKKLKPHYQKVINLRFFNEMSYAEIANVLNEPVNNVKVKLLRAKKLLAGIINNK